MSFPTDFFWGVAAAAYQIEGAKQEGGKGLSVWDDFCTRPGMVLNGDTGDTACDHYHRFAEDIALMKDLGVRAYRLSLSWPRILPEGTGRPSPEGLAFYDRLIDAILAAGITPFVTLFHWDFPLALMRKKGWANPDSPDWFAEYTRVVADRLSDRVQWWMTFNEPQCFIGFGYYFGSNAPGLRLPLGDALAAGHHVMLAHGKAVQILRTGSKREARIGYAPMATTKIPATDAPADIEAARARMFASDGADPMLTSAWWMDPVLLGRYPEDGLRVLAPHLPRAIRSADMRAACPPIDFLGVNIYSGIRVRAGRNGAPEELGFPPGAPQTAIRWWVTPESMYWGPRFYAERYRLPILITENGFSGIDWVMYDGKVHDPQRIDFTRAYLRQLHRAVADGVDVRGYFHWSILDNFEWARGYQERFGLVHVDFETQKRTPKDSAYWYGDVCRTNGESLLR